MGIQLSNNATSTLASGITAGDLSLTVQTGDGDLFPVLGGGQWFPITVSVSSDVFEIMRVTARTGDTFTVTRAQEGTTAISFSAGSGVELRLTALSALSTTETAINEASGKSSPADADTFGINDTADSNVLKKVTFGEIRASFKTTFDGIYLPIAGTASNSLSLGGVAAANYLRSDSSGTLNGNLTVTGDILAEGSFYYGDNKEIIDFADTYLRLNQNGDFPNGVYTPGNLRADGNMTVHGEFYLGVSGGGDSWIRYHDDNSNTERLMGWDDSANAFVAEENDGGFHKLALVYDGSSSSETNYPIGHTVFPQHGVSNPVINGSYTTRRQNAYDFSLSSGTALSGTWRARGRGYSNQGTIMVRVA